MCLPDPSHGQCRIQGCGHTDHLVCGHIRGDTCGLGRNLGQSYKCGIHLGKILLLHRDLGDEYETQ